VDADGKSVKRADFRELSINSNRGAALITRQEEREQLAEFNP